VVVEIRARIPLSNLTHYGAFAISVITLIALVVYPIPFCIDCESADPWGHGSTKGELPVALWLLAAPFLAGVAAIKRGWIVPLCVVFALLVTQPLGGVAWWSLRLNEGPFILAFGLPLTFACFGIGCIVRVLVRLSMGVVHPHHR
jgi:hypothetical protein